MAVEGRAPPVVVVVGCCPFFNVGYMGEAHIGIQLGFENNTKKG